MAINVIQIKPVSRGAGQSATACAAYRSGDVIECGREGKTHDYSHKTGILKQDSAIILPTGLSADWAKDRSSLWNAAEAAEKRKDGRVAREYVIALPKEANQEERKKLAMDFAQYLANRYQVAVDVNLHQPHRSKSGDNDNYHAHLLTTTREITPDGLGKKSTIELSDTDRFKLDLPKSKDELFIVREHWTDLQNTVLKNYGLSVSALSYKDQGLDIEPTFHMGAQATALERQGVKTEIGDMNRAITARNLEKGESRIDRPLDLDQEIELTERTLVDLKYEQFSLKIDHQLELDRRMEAMNEKIDAQLRETDTPKRQMQRDDFNKDLDNAPELDRPSNGMER
jgi:hypothetical protein